MLVIGVGNPMRRDDGAGPSVLDLLADRKSIETIAVIGDCARLIELWDGRREVVVVDATWSGAAPGKTICFDGITADIPRDLFIHTSHAFGVAEAVTTARLLDRLPTSLTVWGIEGADFGYGDRLTPEVRDNVEKVAAEIVNCAQR